MLNYIKRKLPHNLKIRKIFWKFKWILSYFSNKKILDWIEIIWVSWTDWKTTTCNFIAQLFFNLKIPVAMMSSEQHFLDWEIIENKSKRTTSSAFEIFEFIKKAKKKWIKIIILEISSHSLEQWRVFWFSFDYSVITNLSREHLDYHKTIENYAKTKAKLFEKTKKLAILPKNILEKNIFNLSISCEKIETFIWEKSSEKNTAIAKNLIFKKSWTQFDLDYKWKVMQKIFFPVLWDYNVENLLFAIILAKKVNKYISEKSLKIAISKIKLIPWRLDELKFWQKFRIFNSFAVTPFAIEKLLKYAQKIKEKKWKVWIIYWATWGQHDHTKRPFMWEITGKFADFSMITEDETYWEDSMKIIKEVEKWIIWTKWEYKIIQERSGAISYVLENAKKEDIVIITWMWSFNTRNIWGIEEKWSDIEFIKNFLNQAFLIPKIK